MSEKPSISALVKRFREAPPTSPGHRGEAEKPRYQAPPQPQSRNSTNYSDIVRALRKSSNGSANNTSSNGNPNRNMSPVTSYAGLGGDNDDFIAREIRQLKRDMHFEKSDLLNRSMDSTGYGRNNGLKMPEMRFSNDFDLDTGIGLGGKVHSSATYSPPSSSTRFRFNPKNDLARSNDSTATLGNTGFKGLLMPELKLYEYDKPTKKKDEDSDKNSDKENNTDYGVHLQSNETDDIDNIRNRIDGLLKNLTGAVLSGDADPGSGTGSDSIKYSETNHFGEVKHIGIIGTKLESDMTNAMSYFTDKQKEEDAMLAERNLIDQANIEYGRKLEREKQLLSAIGKGLHLDIGESDDDSDESVFNDELCIISDKDAKYPEHARNTIKNKHISRRTLSGSDDEGDMIGNETDQHRIGYIYHNPKDFRRPVNYLNVNQNKSKSDRRRSIEDRLERRSRNKSEPRDSPRNSPRNSPRRNRIMTDHDKNQRADVIVNQHNSNRLDIINNNTLLSTAQTIDSCLTSAMEQLNLRLPPPPIPEKKRSLNLRGNGNNSSGNGNNSSGNGNNSSGNGNNSSGNGNNSSGNGNSNTEAKSNGSNGTAPDQTTDDSAATNDRVKSSGDKDSTNTAPTNNESSGSDVAAKGTDDATISNTDTPVDTKNPSDPAGGNKVPGGNNENDANNSKNSNKQNANNSNGNNKKGYDSDNSSVGSNKKNKKKGKQSALGSVVNGNNTNANNTNANNTNANNTNANNSNANNTSNTNSNDSKPKTQHPESRKQDMDAIDKRLDRIGMLEDKDAKSTVGMNYGKQLFNNSNKIPHHVIKVDEEGESKEEMISLEEATAMYVDLELKKKTKEKGLVDDESNNANVSKNPSMTNQFDMELTDDHFAASAPPLFPPSEQLQLFKSHSSPKTVSPLPSAPQTPNDYNNPNKSMGDVDLVLSPNTVLTNHSANSTPFKIYNDTNPNSNTIMAPSSPYQFEKPKKDATYFEQQQMYNVAQCEPSVSYHAQKNHVSFEEPKNSPSRPNAGSSNQHISQQLINAAQENLFSFHKDPTSALSSHQNNNNQFRGHVSNTYGFDDLMRLPTSRVMHEGSAMRIIDNLDGIMHNPYGLQSSVYLQSGRESRGNGSIQNRFKDLQPVNTTHEYNGINIDSNHSMEVTNNGYEGIYDTYSNTQMFAAPTNLVTTSDREQYLLNMRKRREMLSR